MKTKFNEFKINEMKRSDYILDKIGKIGYENISDEEKDYLKKLSTGEISDEDINSPDEGPEVTIGDKGELLIGGKSSTAYYAEQKRKENQPSSKDQSGYRSTKKGGGGNKLEVRVYIKLGENTKYIYMWELDEKNPVPVVTYYKTISEKGDKEFGTFMNAEKLQGMNANDLFNKLEMKYDRCKELDAGDKGTFKKFVDLMRKKEKTEFDIQNIKDYYELIKRF